jgi:hypothetical protein
MARWLVQLVGEHMDLAEFPRCFPDGHIFALEENGNFYLTGQAFEVLGNVEAVRQEASRALDRFAGVNSLLWPNWNKRLLPCWGDGNVSSKF